jgi:S-adenosylmethionine-dependent methyltransferase
VGEERRPGRRHGVETGLRTAAVWEQVLELTRTLESRLGRPLRVLDVGGGTGGLAVPLAEKGHHVTVIDPSPDALASLRRRADESPAADRITALQGDADTLSDLVTPGDVDLICCHGTLEVVDDPRTTLVRLAEVLTPGAYLSLVTAQRLAAVLARVLAGQFHQARTALLSDDGRWGDSDPLPRRFDQAPLVGLVGDAGFDIEVVHGVRIFSDLVPSSLVDSDAERTALLELERAAAELHGHDVLGQLGAAVHVLGRRV